MKEILKERRRLRSLGVTCPDSLVIFGCFLVLYLLSRTAVHGQAEDAWLMVVDYTRCGWGDLLHPHHLLYGPLAHLWWKLWSAAGADDAYRTIQTLNSILGALAVSQVYLLGRDMKISRQATVWAAVASGVSFGCWWLSSEIEVAPLSLLVFTLSLRYFWFMTKTQITTGRVVIAAMITLLAVCVHIFHLSLVLAAVYVIVKKGRRISPSDDARSRGLNRGPGRVVALTAAYLFSFTALLFCLYGIADNIAGSHVGAFGCLVGYFKPDPSPGFGLRTPFLFAVGLMRSLFGVEIMFRLPDVVGTAAGLFPGKDFSDEIFLVRNMSIHAASGLTILMIIVVVLLGVSLVGMIKRFPVLIRTSPDGIAFLSIGLLAVSLPVVVTGPILYNSTANNEHLLPFWALWFLMTALVYDGKNGLKTYGRLSAAALLILVIVVNGTGAIMAMKEPGNDLTLSNLTPWTGLVKGTDVVILHLTERDAAAFEYLTDARVINTMHESIPSGGRLTEMSAENNGRVWVQRVDRENREKYPSTVGFRLERLKIEEY